MWQTPAPLSTAEGCGSRTCTAGLFSQKSAIASPKPDASSSMSDTVKQTDNVVSACATHWTTHAGWLTSDRDSVLGVQLGWLCGWWRYLSAWAVGGLSRVALALRVVTRQDLHIFHFRHEVLLRAAVDVTTAIRADT